jgi:hypothetical protein
MATAKKAQTEPVTVRPEELADELGVNGKAVRAFLRKNFARAAEAKGSRWTIDASGPVAAAVREKFTPQPATEKAAKAS